MNHQTVVNGESQRYGEPQTIASPRATIGARIRQLAETQPDNPAIVSSGFAPLSFRQLHSEIGAVRAALRRAGFDRSTRVAVAMPNGPQTALAIVAVSCSAVCVPLNPSQTLHEIERCLAAVQPDAVLLIKGVESVARDAAAAAGLTIIEAVPVKGGTLSLGIAAPPAATAASDRPDEPDPEAPAFVMQTSGTTAEPKLIPFSHRNMLAAASRLRDWYGLTAQDRCLSASPLFYSHGIKVTMFTPLLSGGTVAFPTNASRFDYVEWFQTLKPTWYSAGPTLHRLIFDQIKSRATSGAGHSLRFVVSGGAPLPRAILNGLQETLGVPVVEQYGTSEAAVVASNSPPPGRYKPGTCGVPAPNSVKIVADDGRQLPADEQGELLIGGESLTSGYLNAGELNRACFVGGWFKTGDIGSIDADGFLTLHGRKNDLINRGGEKISPLEIDEALVRHPAVAEAAAFAVPHPRLGEDVAAAVVLRPGMVVTPAELRRYLRDHLASFKVPRRVLISDQLPKGATGKILRRRLTESLRAPPTAENRTAALQTVEDASIDRELISQLTAIWERLLKTASIAPDDDFFEKGGDSLLAVSLLSELDELMGEPVPPSILLEASTIRQLAHNLSERSNSKKSHIFRVHPDGHRSPLILFHGDYVWGGGPLVGTLANLLGPEQPLVVVAPHGAGDDPILPSIEAMAAERLPLILQSQPEGPYRVGGYCIGGIVAFETARLLIAAGKDVEMVFMIDPPTINARKSMQWLLSAMKRARPFLGTAVDRAMAWTWYRSADVQKFCNVSPTRRWTALKKIVRTGGDLRSNHEIDRARTLAAFHGSVPTSPLGRFADAGSVAYAAAMSNYFPRPLDVRVVYISIDYGIGAWRRITADIESFKLPGTHYHLEFPKIADVLNMYLPSGK
jgi:acyl-CoA synthetase (AMP-forming)/AMP-acid ligase II